MIKYTDQSTIKNQLFTTPFQQELDPTNKWVCMAELIPWDKLAGIFMKSMSSKMGRSTVDLRTIMGAMFIQQSLNLTDRMTIEMISENVYMQYFVGLATFQTAPIFDFTLLSIFRQRLGKLGGEELNEIIIRHAFETEQIKHRKPRRTKKEDGVEEDKEINTEQVDSGNLEGEIKDGGNENRGTVKIDATVVPQNITYPTDAKLLNHSREISEYIIDELYEQVRDEMATKPRTYRREARSSWLGYSRSRKPKRKTIRKQLKSQLGYIKRNLKHIDIMFEMLMKSGKTIVLAEGLRKKMYVISEIYRQQQEMYTQRRNSISDRIVNVSQPWVRPIVRGKAGHAVEFGAKINLSLTEQLAKVDVSSFDAFNESTDLIAQLNGYNELFGYYPEYALVDKIYLTRKNRKFMKSKGIKHTGAPLGRPKAIPKAAKAKFKKKNNERNHVEGKFGQAKQTFGLDNLRTKTKASSYCAINLIVLAMNLLALFKKSLLSNYNTIESTIKDHILFVISILSTNKQLHLLYPLCRISLISK